MSPQQIVSKIWSYCQVLRDNGVSTLDYVEQLTFLLFLKMADEQTQPTGPRVVVPDGYDWPSRCSTPEGTTSRRTTSHVLEHLGKQPGCSAQIFQKAQNQHPEPSPCSAPPHRRPHRRGDTGRPWTPT